MEYKLTVLEGAQVEPTGLYGSISGLASVWGGVDAYRDTVVKGAYAATIDSFLRNGFLSDSHSWDNPIGTPVVAQETKDGLFCRFDYHSTPRAQEARTIAAERLLRQKSQGLSIGYEAVKHTTRDDGVRELREIKLYEVGQVMVPADSAALVSAVKSADRPDWRLVLQALASGDLDRLIEQRAVAADAPPAYKGALPYVATAKADPGASWDGPATMADCDGRAQLRAVCTWVDPEGDPDAKSSYKLPHHLPNGEVVLKGVQAAMGALLGARGGVAIPDADRRAVYAHLAKHLKDAFEETPPEFRTAQPLDDHTQRVLAELDALGRRYQDIRDLRAKEGRVLSRATITRLKEVAQAHAAVGDQLAAMVADHESQEDGKAAERLFADYLRANARLLGVV